MEGEGLGVGSSWEGENDSGISWIGRFLQLIYTIFERCLVIGYSGGEIVGDKIRSIFLAGEGWYWGM